MFGITRTILALMVVVYHLLIPSTPLGTYAVFGFYVISGFLMTSVMKESYGYSFNGRAAFFKNRFLRLYPQYWFACIVTLILIFILGSDFVEDFHGSMYLPASGLSLISNLSIVFPVWMPNSFEPRLVPPSWALSVEIFFYVLICLGLSRSLLRVKIWLIASLGYVVVTFLNGSGWEYRYFPVAAASLPFSLGALAFFIVKEKGGIQKFNQHKLAVPALLSMVLINTAVFMVLCYKDISYAYDFGLYTNVLFCFLLVVAIAQGGVIPGVSRKLDSALGDFSYPFYLLHWQCGLLASSILFAGEDRFSLSGLSNFLLTMIVLVIFSYLAKYFIDEPIQRIRRNIKAKNEAAISGAQG